MFAKDIIFSYVYDLQCHNIFFTSSFQLCSRIVGWISSKEQVAPALQPTQEPSRGVRCGWEPAGNSFFVISHEFARSRFSFHFHFQIFFRQQNHTQQ